MAFQSILGGLVQLRNKMYDSGFLKTQRLNVPVISVGNITMGGTGKTPFVLWLIQNLKSRNLKVAVVVKSYKAGLKEPRRVTTDYNEARHCGDEAVLIALKHPDVIVWAGPDKTDTAKALIASEGKIDFLIVDDGFQHRKLQRDLDIVLLDTSVEITDYCFPPVGRAREKIQRVSRAGVFVLTKLDQANPKTLEFLKENLQLYSQKIVLSAEQRFEEIRYFKGVQAEFQREQACLAFSGLGNSTGFTKSLGELKLKLVKVLNFKDHQNYDYQMITEIIKEAGGHQLITTEKDAVKLQDWPLTGSSLFVLPIQMQVQGAIDSFYEKITQLLR